MRKEDMLIIILLAVLVLAAVTASVALILLLRLRKKNDIKVNLRMKKDFLYSSYGFAMKFSLLRKYMNKIRRRIEMLDLSDDWTISRKTMRFTFISLGVSFILLLVLLLLSTNLYSVLISVFTVYVLHNQIIKMMVDKLDNKLLRQFETFLVNVRHHYHEHGMVDEAIYDSTGECGYEMSLHAGRMYEVLTDPDIDVRVEQFNEVAPNKYMRAFLAMSYLVQRFGDKSLDGKSVYLNNLNYLKQEINMELLRREKLGYLFQSLSTITVFPIFTLSLIRKWAVSNIPELHEYYDGAYGFIAVVVLFALVTASYQLISRLQANVEYAPSESRILTALLKVPPIRNCIDVVYYKKYSKALRYERLLNKTGTRMSINEFILKQIIYAAAAFLLCIVIVFNIHFIVRHNILYSSLNLKMADYDSRIDRETELKIIESDREYIREFRNRKVTFYELEERLLHDGTCSDSKQAAIAAQRILKKIEKYRAHGFKWWELLISIALSAVSYYIPYWLLLFREHVLKMSMEDEVKQFHTIILMLMHIERIDVENILHWMEQFADIFKASIQKCINNYEYGDRQALEQLIIDEPYPPFVRIVENLISAANKITVEQAFDELRLEREYYQEKRKQDNEIMVNKKGMWGRFIAFIPMGATIFLYLIVPFVLVSTRQMMNFSEEVSKML
ncbi:MAG: hypothetical protein GXZ01_03930 [Clostridiaceae bacterium]|nr:hypothetical protein [Clostridiaceae bacterium]